jgi:hypothetical protein
MRIKLLRCQICSDWFSPFRATCPACGSARIHVSSREMIHVDPSNESRPMIHIVNGTSRYNFSGHALEIARMLNTAD